MSEKRLRAAVIVNDIGEVNIDAELIARGGAVELDDSLVALQNGCICCSLKDDLIQQVLDLIATNRFDCILIEASGICEPMPIAQALIGGGFGAAISKAITQGAKRGLFSNEAGMGSTPHAHALANVKDPHEQGTTAMIGVFIDTFVVLTMTALVVISALYCGNVITPDSYEALSAIDGYSANMAQVAFASTFAKLFGATAGGIIGSIFVAICLLFFAFSTIISWNYFGKVNYEHLFGKKWTIVYSVVAVIFVFVGARLKNDLVWELTDVFNGLMVIPNVIALVTLGGLVVSLTKFDKKALPEIKTDKQAD